MADNRLSTSYLLLVGVIVIALAAIFAVLQPLLAAVQSLQAEIAQQQTAARQREAFLQTLDGKVAALAGQAEHEKQLNVILPGRDETEDILREIRQAENASGGIVQKVDNVSAGVQNSLNARRARGEAGSLPADVVPLGFEIEFTGSYQQLRVFIKELQRAPRLLDIMSLDIQRNVEVLDSLTAVFTAQSYRYADEKK